MTQEDKELLLKDLTARLSYGVKGIITYDKSNTTFTVEGIDNNVLHLSDAEECHVEDFKPYLSSMSSMTEEENKELFCLADEFRNSFFKAKTSEERLKVSSKHHHDCCQLYYSHHLDCVDLIEKGLALETPEGMYNIKEK